MIVIESSKRPAVVVGWRSSGKSRLNAEVPGVEERQFAKVHKAGDTDIVVTVIPPDDLKALPSVDVREYVDAESYTGPTKKGVRFAWEKLPEFIGILQTQARQLGGTEKAQAILFPEARPGWVQQAEKAGTDKRPSRDSVLHELLPEGPKDFPGEFLGGKKETVKLELPSEPISVVVLPGGGHAVQSDFGFRHDVRNPTEGNFLCYAYLRGHRTVSIPTEMIEIFRAVKAYETFGTSGTRCCKPTSARAVTDPWRSTSPERSSSPMGYLGWNELRGDA